MPDDVTAVAPEVPTTTSDVPNQIPQPQTGGSGAAPPQPPVTAVATAPQPAPQPPQRSGLSAILAAVGNALGGGATRGQVNPQTGAIEQVNRSTGSKIGSAISTLARGAAAGAAQHGPGATGRAALAGVQAQDEFQQQQEQKLKGESENVRQTQAAGQQQLLTQASLNKSKQELAGMVITNKAAGLTMSEHLVDIANKAESIKSLPGAKVLGTFDSNDQLNEFLEGSGKELSGQFAADFARNKIVPVLQPDGKFAAVQLPKPLNEYPAEAGQKVPFPQFGPDKNGKMSVTGVKWHDATPGMTMGEVYQNQVAAATTIGTFEREQAQKAHEEATTTEAAANAKKAGAETGEANARTGLISEQTKQLKDETSGTASRSQLVQDVVHGNIVPERYGYMLGKKEGQEFLSEVSAEAAKEGVPLDTSKLAAYPKVYDQYTSTKPGNAGYAINAGATGLKHLQELERLNTIGSRVPGTAASKAFNNQLDTVVPELIKFYGMPDTDKSVSSLKSTLGGLTNRDAAIRQQAHALGQKLDEYGQQWKNAAPSPVYQAAMPNMTDDAKYARAHLDPEYAAKLFSLSQWKQANPNADDAMMKHVESEARQRNLEIVK